MAYESDPAALVSPLTLLVAQSPSVVGASAKEWASRHSVPLVSVNEAFVAEKETTKPDLVLDQLVSSKNEDTLVLHDASLLFLPRLKLDPLSMLRRLSKSRQIVFAWPGAQVGGRLCYAVPEHAHYRTWGAPHARIIQVR